MLPHRTACTTVFNPVVGTMVRRVSLCGPGPTDLLTSFSLQLNLSSINVAYSRRRGVCARRRHCNVLKSWCPCSAIKDGPVSYHSMMDETCRWLWNVIHSFIETTRLPRVLTYVITLVRLYSSKEKEMKKMKIMVHVFIYKFGWYFVYGV